MAALRRSEAFTVALSSAVTGHHELLAAGHSALSRLAPCAASSPSASSLDRSAEALLAGIDGLAAHAAAASWASTAAPASRPLETLERHVYCHSRKRNVPQTWAQKIAYYEDGVEVMVTLPGGGEKLVRRPPLRLWSDAASVNWVSAHVVSALLRFSLSTHTSLKSTRLFLCRASRRLK